FMLEDFIGGHTAVGNLVMLVLAYIAKNHIIGEQEVDFVSNYEVRSISLYDMNKMPYTMAVILEVLRHSSSPNVPHVAMEDTVLSGFGVTKGTIVFINNFILSINENNWKYPDQFEPQRFLDIKHTDDRTNVLKCIPHFLPFSVGKRTCLGKNLVRGFGFHLLVHIIKNYNVNRPLTDALHLRHLRRRRVKERPPLTKKTSAPGKDRPGDRVRRVRRRPRHHGDIDGSVGLPLCPYLIGTQL
ncbi:cytochrome P450 307a1-like, partial [Drosophila eugracilis]|uniref:cytochrome P450 307a1-like n=1 Tax=Drosophila eugracilis TaxID=29029 RepID=UPI001BDAECEE